MATKRKTVTEEVNAVTEEVNAVTEEVNAVTEERPSALRVAEAERALNRMRQNAMVSRDPMAWERYRGACEVAGCLGYTISMTGERSLTLTETV